VCIIMCLGGVWVESFMLGCVIFADHYFIIWQNSCVVYCVKIFYSINVVFTY
jgi:hypothetical protein